MSSPTVSGARTIAQNDTTPALVADLTYVDGTPAQLNGSTVNLVIKSQDGSSTYLDKPCTFVGNTVTYTWQAGDTAVPGEYVGAFFVTFPDNETRWFPTEGYFPLTITPELTGSAKPRPTYLTTADLITQTRVYLDGRIRPGRNKLASDIGISDETLALTYDTAGAADGVTISIGLETMWVWAATGRSLTVERGIEGTIPSQHASGDVIQISPEYTDSRILQALNLELAALPAMGVYAVKSLDRTLVSTATGYDLASDVEDVLDVRWQDVVDASQWTPVESWEIARDMPTSVFPSGVALILPDRPYYDPYVKGVGTSNALRIRYRTTFKPLQTLFDDVLNVSGISVSAVDILPLGAALRLLAGRAIPRINPTAQPDPRNAAEVRVSDVLNAPGRLQQLHDKRVQDEAARLSRDWVYRQPARTLMGSNQSMSWRWRYGRWGL